MKPQTIIFFGMQGSGKGTQVALLQKYLKECEPDRGVVHYETGKGFRSIAEMNGYTAQRVREELSQGNMLPTSLATMLWSQAFMDEFTGKELVLIDGFPRSQVQADILHEALQFYKLLPAQVIFLDIKDTTAIDRLTKRGRHDDTPDIISNRIAWYREHVQPITDWYKAHSEYEVHHIDAEMSEGDIHKEILKVLNLEKG